MSKEDVKDSKMTVFFSYLRNKSVWTLSQNLQISPILQNPRGGNYLLLPVTGYAHDNTFVFSVVQLLVSIRIKVRTLTTCSGTMVPPRWCAPCSSRSISPAGSKVCWDLRLVVSKLGILSLFVVVSIPKFGVPALGNSVTAFVALENLRYINALNNNNNNNNNSTVNTRSVLAQLLPVVRL